ncbi:MAG: ExbD/TolR family protein [Methylomonas sp.]
MGFKTNADDDDAVSEINVTPLVDVMLVLVIILLVTAPLVTQSVNVTLPKTAASKPDIPKEPLQIEIKGNNCDINAKAEISLNKTPISNLSALETTLIHELEQNPDVAIHLWGDENVSYAKVEEVVTAVTNAGISKISFVTMEK